MCARPRSFLLTTVHHLLPHELVGVCVWAGGIGSVLVGRYSLLYVSLLLSPSAASLPLCLLYHFPHSLSFPFPLSHATKWILTFPWPGTTSPNNGWVSCWGGCKPGVLDVARLDGGCKGV